MTELREPYFVSETDVVEDDYIGFAPGNDFNREIIPPGESDSFPDGAIGVRIDDDFWAVAALPYEKYIDVPIEDIVAEFWPNHTNPTFGPDSKHYKKEPET